MLLLFCPLATQADLLIEDAWIKNLPLTVPVRAVYKNISNTGEEAVSIVSPSSKIFSNIKLHETIIKDGVMHMRQINDLMIAADQQIT